MSLIFSKALLSWFDKHGRHDLPWQKDISPYRVWVSEIMLQQTQVSTVIPYFEKFINRFPSLLALANASDDDVMHHWSGLGYYSRARHLHQAAQIIRDRYEGDFPTDFDTIRSLPGIGRSTAGAICAIALEQHYPILDGNVKRVLTRLHTISGWPSTPKIEQQLWQIAEKHTPKKRVADYTQAIMDLGATLCKRTRPECHHCPVNTLCQAYIKNSVNQFPEKKLRKNIPTRETTLLILCDENKNVLLTKRPITGIWSGLWSLIEKNDRTITQVCQQYACRYLSKKSLPTFRHTFSHFHLDIHPMIINIQRQGQLVAEPDKTLWYNTKKPLSVGLAAPVKKLLETL